MISFIYAGAPILRRIPDFLRPAAPDYTERNSSSQRRRCWAAFGVLISPLLFGCAALRHSRRFSTADRLCTVEADPATPSLPLQRQKAISRLQRAN